MYNQAARMRAAPALTYVAPAISLALSLPTLLGLLALGALAGYHALTGHTIDLSVLQPLLQWPLAPAFLLHYGVFGPMAGIVSCLAQRARAQGASEGTQALEGPSARLNAAALRVAALTLGMVMSLIALGMVLRGGT